MRSLCGRPESRGSFLPVNQASPVPANLTITPPPLIQIPLLTFFIQIIYRQIVAATGPCRREKRRLLFPVQILFKPSKKWALRSILQTCNAPLRTCNVAIQTCRGLCKPVMLHYIPAKCLCKPAMLLFKQGMPPIKLVMLHVKQERLHVL